VAGQALFFVEDGMTTRGYSAIGIFHGKTEANIGTLWRSANLFDAAFIFTVGRRYKTQASDTMNTPAHIPLFHFETLEDMRDHLPHGCKLVGIEMSDRAVRLAEYTHPERACYLLGAEDHGLNASAIIACHDLVCLPGRFSMNVAVAGSIVLYDRATRR